MLEVVILRIIYLIKYVFQVKQDLNLTVFNVITGINESKTLAKHISCECKCRFDVKNVIQIHSGIMINVMTMKKMYLESCYM